jgi:hypothetical protein
MSLAKKNSPKQLTRPMPAASQMPLDAMRDTSASFFCCAAAATLGVVRNTRNENMKELKATAKLAMLTAANCCVPRCPTIAEPIIIMRGSRSMDISAGRARDQISRSYLDVRSDWTGLGRPSSAAP